MGDATAANAEHITRCFLVQQTLVFCLFKMILLRIRNRGKSPFVPTISGTCLQIFSNHPKPLRTPKR